MLDRRLNSIWSLPDLMVRLLPTGQLMVRTYRVVLSTSWLLHHLLLSTGRLVRGTHSKASSRRLEHCIARAEAARGRLENSVAFSRLSSDLCAGDR